MTQAHTPDQLQARPTRLPAGLGVAIRAVELALLVILTGVVARFIWLVAFGASAGDFRQDSLDVAGIRSAAPAYVADISRLRDTALFTDPRQREATPAAAETVPETRLALVLRGVRQSARAGTGGAIIQTPDNRQHFFRVGAEILDGVTLEAVHVDHVRISRRGIAELLYLRPEEAAAARAADASRNPAAGPRATATANRRGQLEDVGGLFQVRAQYAGDSLTGYRIESGSEAMLSVLGLRIGDVVTAIDERPVAAIADLTDLLDREGGGEPIRVSISRGGLPLTLSRTLPQ